MVDTKNTGKAALTKKYLGVDALGDADNPSVYQTSQIVSALPICSPVTIGGPMKNLNQVEQLPNHTEN